MIDEIDKLEVQGLKWHNKPPTKIAILAIIYEHGGKMRSKELMDLSRVGKYGLAEPSTYKAKSDLQQGRIIRALGGTQKQSIELLPAWEVYKPAVLELLEANGVDITPPPQVQHILASVDAMTSRPDNLPAEVHWELTGVRDADRQLDHLQNVIHIMASKLTQSQLVDVIIELGVSNGRD